jgi:D-alanyl-D-alanine dipeptidase
VRNISSHEPVTQLRHIPIVDCGEPLVNYLKLSNRIFPGKGRWVYTRETLLREGVALRLVRSAASLPGGYSLAVLEGWRPPHIQKRMYQAAYNRWKEKHPDWSDLALRRLANRFTAPIHPKVPPPHTTGGALDVWLADDSGEILDHIRPFDVGDRRSYPTSAKGLGAKAIDHRKILYEAMSSSGITNYPSEYWHWSYGDQGWAYRGGHGQAHYGPTTPPNYVPPKGEDTDEPLEWRDLT